MQVPEMELEVFVHGRCAWLHPAACLLSGYINKRDPKSRVLLYPTPRRWEYKARGQGR